MVASVRAHCNDSNAQWLSFIKDLVKILEIEATAGGKGCDICGSV